MQANDHIGITFAAAYNSVAGSIVTAGIIVEVAATTEKAVKLKSLTRHGKTIEAWVPKKALLVHTVTPSGNSFLHCAHVAKWFRPDGWTQKFFDLSYQGGGNHYVEAAR